MSVFYWTIAACIAELGSAIPSTAGVYHWATVTPGNRWGRLNGYYAGYWNFLGWNFASASAGIIVANLTVHLYRIYHPGFESKAWHVFIAYLIMIWIGSLVVCFFNEYMPLLNLMGIFFILAGVSTTIIVCAAMPGTGGRPAHASSAFVWEDWVADLGYPDGFVFVIGMLNGAVSVGTPDLVVHLAEEIPRPHSNVPKAVGVAMATGFVTGFAYLITILYAINDLESVSKSLFPIGDIYAQATGTRAGATGLLFILLVPMVLTAITSNITTGRGLWTLARDGATPFSHFFAQIDENRRVPFNATISCAVLNTLLGCLYLGSTTAFNSILGSFVILTTASYTAAILPNLLTGRKNIRYGPFEMRGWVGFVVNGVACLYMIVFLVIFCFPYFLPTEAKTMNYNSLIFGGLTLLVTAWYFLGGRKGYTGPQTIGGKVYEADLIRKVKDVKGH